MALHESALRAGVLKRSEEEELDALIGLTASEVSFETSLKLLSRWLYRAYGEKTVILIDEYDTPIQQGYLNGYYDQVIGFMRNLLSGALKDNGSLEKGVLTGILRIAKESVFSGLNNLDSFTVSCKFRTGKWPICTGRLFRDGSSEASAMSAST